MCVDPLKRADLEEILHHAWLKNDFQMKEKAEKIMATSKSQKTVESNNNKRELDTSSQEGVSNKRIKCEWYKKKRTRFFKLLLLWIGFIFVYCSILRAVKSSGAKMSAL